MLNEEETDQTGESLQPPITADGSQLSAPRRSQPPRRHFQKERGKVMESEGEILEGDEGRRGGEGTREGERGGGARREGKSIRRRNGTPAFTERCSASKGGELVLLGLGGGWKGGWGGVDLLTPPSGVPPLAKRAIIRTELA